MIFKGANVCVTSHTAINPTGKFKIGFEYMEKPDVLDVIIGIKFNL